MKALWAIRLGILFIIQPSVLYRAAPHGRPLVQAHSNMLREPAEALAKSLATGNSAHKEFNGTDVGGEGSRALCEQGTMESETLHLGKGYLARSGD